MRDKGRGDAGGDAEAGPAAAPRPGAEITPAQLAARERNIARRRAERRSRARQRDAIEAEPLARPGSDDDDDEEEFLVERLPARPGPPAGALPATVAQPGLPAEAGVAPQPRQPTPHRINVGRAGRPGRRSPWLLILSFLAMVAAPGGWIVWYLYTQAADQYHSVVAFSVRTEEPTSALPEITGTLMQGFTGALDSVILSEFIDSQQMVRTLDDRVGLRAIYNLRPDDWVFTFGEDRSIEDLLQHWRFMTDVDFDEITSIINVTAYAFTPEDARRITEGVLEASTSLINSLSEEARNDAIRFARRDLDEAEARLKEIRIRLREFRDRTQTADPTQDVQVQMGVILALQQSLAEALITRTELLDFARPTDPRVSEVERRIKAIESQIGVEKTKLGSGSEGGDSAVLSAQIGTFEELKTDLGFAEQAYLAAQTAFDQARIEARRQSRYLAVHIEPTLSEESQYPSRLLLSFLGIGALLAAWGLMMLLIYNLGDRR